MGKLTDDKMQSFYCNQKFWWLTVNLEKYNTYSCCAADPQKADIAWVKDNPGKLFNTPQLQHDRRLMLDNQPAPSCQNACWNTESQGLPSRRTIMLGNQKTHSSIESNPEVLNIVVGSDCNLTCVYCCKFYSSAWLRDVVATPYRVDSSDDRFVINNTDKILSQLSQKDLRQSANRQALLDEVTNLYQSPVLKSVMITGGEPFLYLDLEKLVQSIPSHVEAKVWSGLGVAESRFEKEVAKLPKHTTVVISAENIGKQYEFVRYGNSWQRFVNNIEILKAAGIKYEFNATISNLTVFGLQDFVKFVGDDVKVHFSPCNDPDFLSLGVLDNESKSLLKHSIGDTAEFIARALEVDPTEKQVYNLKRYINDYAQRRQLDLSVFPESFVRWVNTY